MVTVTIAVTEHDADGDPMGAQAVTREFADRSAAAEWVERIAHHDVRDTAMLPEEWEAIDARGGF